MDTSIYTNTSPLYNHTQNLHPKGKESFKFIFLDNLNFIYHLANMGKLRLSVSDNIQKTILCGTMELGYDTYTCPRCGDFTIIPHRCHSKLCTTCGAKETQIRSAKVSSMALDAHHRHIVFTIPEELRHCFLADRTLLHLLFIAARNTLACLFNNEKYRKSKKIPKKKVKNLYTYKNDREKVVFGAILTLHTFGRDLKWNPHIHCLVCEEAYDTSKNCMKSFAFMSYEKLRKTWMFQVLDILSKYKDQIKNFRYLKQKFYEVNDNGFYVYAKKREDDNDDNVEECVKYIARYTSRPAMAESRIIKYEDDKKMIRWWYNRHEDEKYIEVYEPVQNFIINVIKHCPNENFKMVRYYGFYSNKNRDLLEKVYELYGRKIKHRKHIKNLKERKKEIKNKLNQLKFRTHMIQSFGRDPILCKCGYVMKYEDTFDPFEGGTINDRHFREKCIEDIRRMGRKSKHCYYD